ncbi:hypothetical protein PR048_015403 [Dryococelus australis]|uniref:Uncharacterized protein n=1 Tax=Dryococelus australis TaxID=614101 RepID=A0ABQ9HGW0_9NEOP|nr:hypothetical protein PR048_015403 [Dryococelus australis]
MELGQIQFAVKHVLFVGVRNKYCTVCVKIWPGSSTSMEQDVIVEGFCRALACMAYGTTQVEKVDNAKLGNYEMRSALKDRIMRLRTAIMSAIKYRKKQSEDKYYVSIEELRKDILKSPFHILVLCDGLPKPKEVNLVNEMEKAGLIKELFLYVQRFVGGKRINFSLASFYKTRYEADMLSVNSGGELHRTIHKLSVKKSPGVHTKTFIGRRDKIAGKLRRRQRELTHRDKNNLDRNDGPNASLSTPDMSQSTYEKMPKNNF